MYHAISTKPFSCTGSPRQVVSDNGPKFVIADFQPFLKNNNIKHVTSTPYQPATNGLAEPFIQTMKHELRAEAEKQVHYRPNLQTSCWDIKMPCMWQQTTCKFVPRTQPPILPGFVKT